MATYDRIVRTFDEDYLIDMEKSIKKFCKDFPDYKAVSCSISTKEVGYDIKYVGIVILEKEE